MLSEHIHANDGLVELWICALCDVIIHVFLVAQSVHALEYKVE